MRNANFFIFGSEEVGLYCRETVIELALECRSPLLVEPDDVGVPTVELVGSNPNQRPILSMEVDQERGCVADQEMPEAPRRRETSPEWTGESCKRVEVALVYDVADGYEEDDPEHFKKGV